MSSVVVFSRDIGPFSIVAEWTKCEAFRVVVLQATSSGIAREISRRSYASESEAIRAAKRKASRLARDLNK